MVMTEHTDEVSSVELPDDRNVTQQESGTGIFSGPRPAEAFTRLTSGGGAFENRMAGFRPKVGGGRPGGAANGL